MKINLEIDLEKAVEREIKHTIDKIIRDNKDEFKVWQNDLLGLVKEKIVEIFIKDYADEIIEKINKDKLAELVSQRTTIELAKRMAGVENSRKDGAF